MGPHLACVTARYDFKPKTRDGLGFDWPISYEDVAPYYDKVEMLIGVYGDNHGLENTPDSPAGCLLPAPKPRAGEALIQKHAKKTGVPVIAVHRAVLTQQLDFKRNAALLHPGNPRAQQIVADEHAQSCAMFLGDGPCGRGCSIKANYPIDDGAPAARDGDRQSRHSSQRHGA